MIHTLRSVVVATIAFSGMEGASAVAQGSSHDTFIAAGKQGGGDLETQATFVDNDPLGVASYLESFGANKALQHYALSMLADGQADRLGKQWAALIADQKGLAKAERKDGSVWWPQAEDVGFFTGGIAAALDRYPQAVRAFSKGAGRAEPTPGQDIDEWLANAAAPLSHPARSAFNRALRAGAFR
ncbi:hypothetical protein ACQKGL_15230 [Ensifer adhaerens]|uniref:hypothetical protein n=1 Tax=Ensifer adhaerens TaxID=106592 RepID=UPI003D082CB2